MTFKTQYVEPLLFGYMFCLFLTMPVEQQLVYHKLCEKRFNQSYCSVLYETSNKSYRSDQDLIQEETAQWGIYLAIAKTLPAVVTTMLYGAWLDRVGRKTIMVLPIIGDLILAATYILNSYFFTAPVSYLLFGAIISSTFGGFAAMLSATFAYISDISNQKSRTMRVTILESMIFLGGVVSNICGGWLLQKAGFIAVFGLIAFVYALQLIYWFFLKEFYLPSIENRRNVFRIKNVKETINVFIKKRPERFRMTIFLLMGSFCFNVMFFIGINGISILYILHPPLSFPSSKIGYFLAELNGLKFLGALLQNFFLVRYYKWSDYSIILLGSFMYCGLTLSIALSKKSWHIYLALLWCLGLGNATSATRASLSKMVSTEEAGKLFSVIASAEVLIALFSSALFGTIYKNTVDISPSFTFWLMAGLTSIPMLLATLLVFFGQKTAYVSLKEEIDEDEEPSQPISDVIHSVNT